MATTFKVRATDYVNIEDFIGPKNEKGEIAIFF